MRLTIDLLHKYQTAGVRHIINNPAAGLFLDMGLGKTITSLTAIADLKSTLELEKALIIAPKRVIDSVWSQEADKWEHTKHLRISKITGTPKQREAAAKAPADVYLVGRDNVDKLCAMFGGSSLPYDAVFIDESSSFKNHASKRFKALKKSISACARVVLLTGTPTPKNVADLWAQIFLLDGGERLGKTITNFRREYLYPAQSSGHVVYKYGVKEGAESTIKNRISDICISMSAADYLELPPCSIVDYPVHLDSKTLKEYKDFERDKVLELQDCEAEDLGVFALNAAALSNKLLQFAGGSVYDENRDVLTVHTAKLEALEELINAANGEPVLIAWNFKHERDSILLRFADLDPQTLDSPDAVENWNEGKTQLLLMHPASGGHGLNLQAGGRYIVWFSPTWSLELYMQLNARLNRQGQENPVFIYRLLTEGTIDSRVAQSLSDKKGGQDALLEAVKAIINEHKKQ